MKRFLALLGGLGFGLEPFLLTAKAASPSEGKTVVPRGTPMEALRGMNPEDLDTSNLDLTLLDKFGTMGLEDHDVELDKWHLVIEGQVEKGLSLTYSDLAALPPLERTILMICPGFFANNGKWKGVSVRELLARAESRAEVTHITFRGPTGTYGKVLRVPLSTSVRTRYFSPMKSMGRHCPRSTVFRCASLPKVTMGTTG